MAMVNDAGHKAKIRATNARQPSATLTLTLDPKEKSKRYNLNLLSNMFLLVKNHNQAVVFKLFSVIRK